MTRPQNINRSEFEKICADIKGLLGGCNLTNLAEDSNRKDLTQLATASGFDARLIALAATAHQLGRGIGKQRIPAAVFYALLRGGLSEQNDRLFCTDASTLERVLSEAVKKKRIPMISGKAKKDAIRRIGALCLKEKEYRKFHKLLVG